METVKIHIAIRIDAEGTVDTGLTVDEWNALSTEERGATARGWTEWTRTEAGTHTPEPALVDNSIIDGALYRGAQVVRRGYGDNPNSKEN